MWTVENNRCWFVTCDATATEFAKQIAFDYKALIAPQLLQTQVHNANLALMIGLIIGNVIADDETVTHVTSWIMTHDEPDCVNE